MNNRIAISAAVLALLTTIVALGATIVHVLPGDPEPAVSVEPSAFVALDEPGQKTPKRRPKSEFVGPELPDERVKTAPRPAEPKPRPAKKQKKLKSAVLQVVTNFDQADVKVNGLAYPEYYEPGEPEGMVLPAGGPYAIEVKYGSNVKNYQLYLRPYETRLLLVELSGYNSGPPAPPPKKKTEPAKKEPKKKEQAKKEEEDKGSGGKITVYSKPPGTVIVDGTETAEKTPGSVELDNGRHEVQMKYETGTVSEKKIVRVRTGSRIKLFFRERKSK